MGLVVVAVVVALAVGLALGGRLERLGALPLRGRWLVALALLAQVAGALGGGPAYAVGLALSTALVVAFLLRNRSLRGTGLVALGLLANALVVAANGAMPVSSDAAARAGAGDLALVADLRHEPLTPQTRLAWLGDVVPVPLPLRPEVVSPGDVAIAAGLAQLVLCGVLGGRRTGSRRPPPTATALRGRRSSS